MPNNFTKTDNTMAKKTQPNLQKEVLRNRVKNEVMLALIEEFRKSGDADTAARQLSAAYLLFTVANHYVEQASELIEKHHLLRKKIKTTANNLTQSFEPFNKEMSSMIGNRENAYTFCNDTTLLTEILDVFLNHHIDVVRGPYFQPKLFLPLKTD